MMIRKGIVSCMSKILDEKPFYQTIKHHISRTCL